MTEVAPLGRALRAEDAVLWRHLHAAGKPVTVVADDPPAWARSLPNFATLLTSAAAATATVRGIVVVMTPTARLDPAVLERLQQEAAELIRPHGAGWQRAPAGGTRRSGTWSKLLRRVPLLANRLGVQVLRPPFRHDGGVCWWASLGGLAVPPPDDERQLLLFEDEQPLPLPDAIHDDIRQLGGGRYSVWDRGVYFASSDGSDPAKNGRRYEVRSVLRREPDRDLATAFAGEEAFAAAFVAAAQRRTPANAPARRVLLFLSSLGPGGAERQFCNLAKGLVARGLEVGICSLDGFAGAAGHYLPLLEGSGVQLVDALHAAPDFVPNDRHLDLLAGLPDLFRTDAWRVLTHVARFAPDVLHCALDKTNLLGAVAGVLTDVPRIVLSMRNVNPTHFPYLDVPWFRRWYLLASQVPGLVLSANSRAGGADYAAWLGMPAERIAVVHNGLDQAAVREPAPAEIAALRMELGIARDAPVIAGVFRLSAEKRPQLWLDTVAALRRQFPGLIAIHVGHGPLAAEVAADVARRGLGNCVRLVGRHADPAMVLAAADLLLLVSTFEGIPNVALEAQWLRRPVVCTAAGGSVEAVRDGETGFVVAEPAAAPLAAACARVLGDRAFAARLGEAGRSHVANVFSVDGMVDGSRALYR